MNTNTNMRAAILKFLKVSQMQKAYEPTLAQLHGLVMAVDLEAIMINSFEAFADEADVKAWIDFYESPAGQRFLQKQPALCGKIGADMELLVKERVRLLGDKA